MARNSQSGANAQDVVDTYSATLKWDFGNAAGARETRDQGFSAESFEVRLASRKKNVELAKNCKARWTRRAAPLAESMRTALAVLISLPSQRSRLWRCPCKGPRRWLCT